MSKSKKKKFYEYDSSGSEYSEVEIPTIYTDKSIDVVKELINIEKQKEYLKNSQSTRLQDQYKHQILQSETKIAVGDVGIGVNTYLHYFGSLVYRSQDKEYKELKKLEIKKSSYSKQSNKHHVSTESVKHNAPLFKTIFREDSVAGIHDYIATKTYKVLSIKDVIISQRLIDKSLKLELKNLIQNKEQINNPHIFTTSFKFNNFSTYNTSHKLANSKKPFVVEKPEAYRQDLIESLNSYDSDNDKTPTIRKSWEKIASFKDINTQLKKLFKSRNVEEEHIEKIKEIVSLLFITESSRNPTTFIMAPIFLELLAGKQITIQDNIKEFPMSMKGAVNASRILTQKYKEFKFTFDYLVSTGDAQELIKKENMLFIKWLKYKQIGSNCEQWNHALIELIKDWYDIDLSNLIKIKIKELKNYVDSSKNVLSSKVFSKSDIKDSHKEIKDSSKYIDDFVLLQVNQKDVINAINSIDTILRNELIPKTANEIDDWNQGQYTDTMQQILLRSYNSKCLIYEKINTVEINTIAEIVGYIIKKPDFCKITGTLEEKIKAIRNLFMKKYPFLKDDLENLQESTFNGLDKKNIKDLISNFPVKYKIGYIKYPNYIKQLNHDKYDCVYKLKKQVYDSFKNEFLSDKIDDFLTSGSNITHMIIPININNNHWTAFIIEKTTKKISYIDTLGHQIYIDTPQCEILSEICTALKVPLEYMQIFKNKVQFDGYNCGPFMIEAVSRIIKNQSLSDFENIKNEDHSIELGDRLRTVHNSLLNNEDVRLATKSHILLIQDNENKVDACDQVLKLIAKLTNEEKRKILQTLEKDSSLKGSNTQEETNIDWINSYFGKYTLDGLNNILDLRLKDLKLKDIKILQSIFIDQDYNNISNILTQISLSTEQTILVPLNLFNKHAVGLVFEKSKDDTIQVKYLDSLNKEIPKELKQLIVDYLNTKVNFQKIITEQQKYANCGAEVIENFILYLTGKRISQEKAIELHSKLVENALLNIDSFGVHLLFEEPSNNCYSCAGYLEQMHHDNHQFYNFDYENHHPALLGQDHNDTI